MPETFEQTEQSSWILKASRIAMIASIVLLALALIGSVAVTVAMTIDAVNIGEWMPMVPAVMTLIAVLIVICWLPVGYGLVRTMVSNESAASRSAGRLGRIETLMEEQTKSLQKLIDLASLSDKAKSLIYQEQEIDALREVILDDVVKQDYETAYGMIETIEQQFGYTDEAARLRDELAAARKATLEEKIDWAIGRVQQIIEIHDWPRAVRAAKKLLDHFPSNLKIASLPERVEIERTKHKRGLLQEYGEAVRKNDVDRSIELLRELDRHLSPQEAAALEESARGIFRTKLHNLGVEFAIHVTDERWADAVATGEKIMRNFPNSRMSQEVDEKMPQLRIRASASEPAATD